MLMEFGAELKGTSSAYISSSTSRSLMFLITLERPERRVGLGRSEGAEESVLIARRELSLRLVDRDLEPLALDDCDLVRTRRLRYTIAESSLSSPLPPASSSASLSSMFATLVIGVVARVAIVERVIGLLALDGPASRERGIPRLAGGGSGSESPSS